MKIRGCGGERANSSGLDGSRRRRCLPAALVGANVTVWRGRLLRRGGGGAGLAGTQRERNKSRSNGSLRYRVNAMDETQGNRAAAKTHNAWGEA